MNKSRLCRAMTYKMGDRVVDIETGSKGTVSSPCGGVGGMVTVLWDHVGERHPARIDCIKKLAEFRRKRIVKENLYVQQE